jgi:hypothetical protein
MHFAAHGISLNRNLTKISPDWMGFAVDHVSELTSDQVSAAYFNGPSGDVSPGVPYWNIPPDADSTTRLRWLHTNHGRNKAVSLGNAVAKEALDLAQSIPVEDFLPNLLFRVYTKTIWVPMKDFKYFGKLKVWFENSFMFLLKRYVAVPLAISHEEPNFPGVAVKHGHHQVNIYTLLQWFCLTLSSDDGAQIKELSILAAPGELFEEIGIRLRSKCPTGPENTFVFQNANDWISYLFPKNHYEANGGYEPYASFTPMGGHNYEREMRKLFREVAAGVNISYS